MTKYLPYTEKEYMTLLRISLRDYEAKIGDVTEEEREALYKWVADGNSPYNNPNWLYDENGCIMDYIQGCRIGEDIWNNTDNCRLWESEEESDILDDDTPF